MGKLFMVVALLFVEHISYSQASTYGDNPKAGNYLNVGDARIYYEVYGSGTPLLLLHGDTFGYIDEFDQYIPLLAKHFKVIATAMRGHGKSEIGTKEFSYKLFAEDALAVLDKEKVDSAIVVGFSAGAITTYYLAAYHPDKIKRAVAMAGAIDTSGYRPEALAELKKYTGHDFERILPDLVKSRKKLMPRPDSYNDLIEKLRASWLQPVYIEREKAAAIKCPVLTVAGDRDEYMQTEQFVRIQQLIPNSQLALIPNCGHVGLILKPKMFLAVVMPFLTAKPGL